MYGREIIIKDTHRGLWYEDGILKRVLEAGRYELPRGAEFNLFGRRRHPKIEVVLVDVREPGERAIVSIPGSVAVPRGRFDSGDAFADIPFDRPVVLHCRSGARSASALKLLRAAGHPDVRHLEGGVLAWVEHVDPGLPTY